LAALLIAAWGLRRRARAELIPWAAWAFAALASPGLLDVVLGTHASQYPRYALAALIPLAFLLGEGLSGLSSRARHVALLLLLLSWAWGGIQLWQQQGRMTLPLREAARVLPETRPGDAVVIQSIPSGALALCRYLDPTLPVLALNGRLSPEPFPVLRRFCAGRPRIALCLFHNVGQPTPALDALRGLGQPAESWQEGSVTWVYFAPFDNAWVFPAPAPLLPARTRSR
jgi:hypothetical protein